MLDPCLRDLASVLGTSCVTDMAKKVGLAGRPICVRSLAGRLSCVTQHCDNGRTGWNPREFKLNVANVPQLQQLMSIPLDGTVYAQPLYVHQITMSDARKHNVVFVATEMDTLYAFDADTLQLLWQKALTPPGESPVPSDQLSPNVLNVRPFIGVTSTPVIDLNTGLIYVVSKTMRRKGQSTSFHQYLWAIDITTGDPQLNGPVEIQASYPGNASPNNGQGWVVFDPKWHLNRPALLLNYNPDVLVLEPPNVYIAFGSHDDQEPEHWHGWIMTYNGATLEQTGAFCVTPLSSPDSLAYSANGSVWQAGIGPAADSSGSVYFSTGNGPFGPPNYGDSVLKLSFGLQLLSYFSPADQAYNLVHDIDLGSGGVLVLPDQPDSPLPLLTMCGKDGKIFLLSRDSLGGYTGPAGNNTNAVQTLPLQPGRQESPNSDENPGVWGGPAYWNGPNGQFLYYCGNGGPLTAFVLQNGELSPAMLPNGEPNQSRMNFPALGGSTPIVSSNQQVPGTAVVWAIARRDDNSQIHLWAFDAANLTNRLVALPAGEWNNPMGNAFIEPTVADGKVFVASSGALTVFGLF